jgi:hypothetical protein
MAPCLNQKLSRKILEIEKAEFPFRLKKNPALPFVHILMLDCPYLSLFSLYSFILQIESVFS